MISREHLSDQIEWLLERVQKATRYTGGEMNTETKHWNEAELHFAFCFPDTYEIAMSHLGMKILYAIINQSPTSLCERVCMPWVDMKALMEKEGVPLFSLESRHPISDFDVVGFTLQYEMSYTNILAMLKLGNIPLRTCDRGQGDPIIVAGGPCAFNPEPLADFIDAFMLGDGEEVILLLNETIRQWKKMGQSRDVLWKQLAQLEGVYVPQLYQVKYHEDGKISSFLPKVPEAPNRVRKCVVTDLDQAFYPTEIPVPYAEIVHDRIMLEVMRGCTRGCRFCEAGMLYRPVRERSLKRLLDLAMELEISTGYEEVSLSSLSTGDYSCLPELVQELIKQFQEKRVALSLPSLRVDSDLEKTLEETQKTKKSSLTFAPEAGTQRLRDVINKGITEADLMKKMADSFSRGWNAVKLYFMIGLPTETDADLDGIGALAKEVVNTYLAVPKEKRARGLRVTCSASSFVPKPFTPFQWEAQDTKETLERKQAYLRNVLNMKGVQFNWHEPELSLLESCFSRGDRRMGQVLLRAFELGCFLDGWSEVFKYDVWMQAFADCGIDPAFYAHRVRERDEILPWDFIDAGVTKAFLWREREKAYRAETTSDCRNGCHGCGLQRFEGVCQQ